MNLFVFLSLPFVLVVFADEEAKKRATQLMERYKHALESKNKPMLFNVLHKKFRLFSCDSTTDNMDRETFWELIDQFPNATLTAHQITVEEAKSYRDNIVKVRCLANDIKLDFDIKIVDENWYLYKERDQNCANQGIPTTAIINYRYMLNQKARDVLGALVTAISQRSIPKIAAIVKSPYTLYYCDSERDTHTKTWPLDGFDFPLPSTHPDPNHVKSKVTILNTIMLANNSIAFTAHGSGFNNYYVADRHDNIYNYKLRFDMNLTCGSESSTINSRKIQYAVFNE